MSKVLDLLSWLVTAQPVVTLVVLLAVTVGLGAGFTRLAPQADNSVFLPDDSRVTAADGKIEAMFGGSTDVVTVTLLFRGDTLTPDGLALDGRSTESGRLRLQGRTAAGASAAGNRSHAVDWRGAGYG